MVLSCGALEPRMHHSSSLCPRVCALKLILPGYPRPQAPPCRSMNRLAASTVSAPRSASSHLGKRLLGSGHIYESQARAPCQEVLCRLAHLVSRCIRDLHHRAKGQSISTAEHITPTPIIPTPAVQSTNRAQRHMTQHHQGCLPRAKVRTSASSCGWPRTRRRPSFCRSAISVMRAARSPYAAAGSNRPIQGVLGEWCRPGVHVHQCSGVARASVHRRRGSMVRSQQPGTSDWCCTARSRHRPLRRSLVRETYVRSDHDWCAGWVDQHLQGAWRRGCRWRQGDGAPCSSAPPP
jgi:hypothetical protein